MTDDQQTRIEAAVSRLRTTCKRTPRSRTSISCCWRTSAATAWKQAAAAAEADDLDPMDARDIVYGMPYAEWKAKHQLPADPEKLARSRPSRPCEEGAGAGSERNARVDPHQEHVQPMR